MKGVALRQETTLPTSAVIVAVLLLGGPVCTSAQPLNLDTNPSFDFGDNPAANPLFTPQLLGLSASAPGFDSVNALTTLAGEVSSNFPPGMEVFVAYWQNPGYAVLPGTALPPTPLGAGSLFSLAASFRHDQPRAAQVGLVDAPPSVACVIPGRTAVAMVAELTQVSVGGSLYELPGPTLFVSPLVLDLNGSGQLRASRGLWLPHPSKLTGPYAAFDMDGDGFKDITEWFGAGAGLLVTTTNPVSGRDLLGTVGGWRDGIAQLANRFDANTNGIVEGAELNGLYVWQDLNTNGVADPGEVVPVQSLGIAWISATNSGNYTASFGYSSGVTATVWDWWPNYALADQRGQSSSVSRILLPPGANLDAFWSSPPSLVSGKRVHNPLRITMEDLATAGIDLATFRMALLADGGNAIIGYESINASPGQPRTNSILSRVVIRPEWYEIYSVVLPVEEVLQVACDPSGRLALVLGDHGSKLALVDFDAQAVTPPEGLDLRSVGLRASGVAGCSDGCFWFSAWQLDTNSAVVDERVWAITPWGFWGGLSLDALKRDLGQLRSYYLTSPESGFFVTPTLGGTNETLWWIKSSCSDTSRVAVAQADAFGGLAAIQAKRAVLTGYDALGPAPPVVAQVTYGYRNGDLFSWAYWSSYPDATSNNFPVVIATSNEPYFYPFLTDGDAALQAQLEQVTGTITYWAATNAAATAPGHAHVTPLLTTYPGQGKVSRGAFAHYGTNGIDIIPLSDAPAPAPLNQVWQYTLLSGSRLTDDCSICGRPAIIASMQGTFRLRLLDHNPLFSTYAIESLSFTAGATNGANYRVVGQGVYQVGGEVGLLQNMFLEVQIDDGQTNRLCYFTNVAGAVTRQWPMLQITLVQTNGSALQTYTLDLNAAPLREIWFSTTTNFHAGIWPASTNLVSSGDLLSTAGHIVKRNQDLTARLGIMPVVPDLGLDAVDLLPGGEIAFSIETNIFSETLGQLDEGDVLSDRGRVVTNYAALIGAFGPEPPIADQGLDALQVLDSGEIHFSVERDFFSEILGRPVGRGDLLSSSGQIVKTNGQLLARFHPAVTNVDYGLDALQVWPSGEIWFSTEDGFQDQGLGAIQPGDLLSDQGYVVYRNRELLAAFAPVENVADFGLDALFVVSDAGSPTSNVAAPRLTGVTLEPSTGNVSFQWDGAGRVFQLEKATNVLGPWLPLGPALTEPPVVDPGALTNSPQGFYRLQQW